MGANCCVAVKNKPLPSPTPFEVSACRHSPTWSFRWDNRTHIEDVLDNAAQFSRHQSANVVLEIKSESPIETDSPSVRSSPSDAFHLQKQHRSSIRTGITAGKLSNGAADNKFTGSNSFPKRKNSTKSSYLVSASTTKLPNSVPSTPYSCVSRGDPSSSRCHSLPSDPTLLRKALQSPGSEFSQQISDNRIRSLQSLDESNSPKEMQSFGLSSCSNGFSREGSHGGSSDGWSMRTFSELLASSNRDRWSFDSINFTSSSSKRTSTNPRLTAQVSPGQQTCGVCSKRLAEHCVVAVLVCEHLYHAECLEKMTIEIDRYDPPCPVCTHGEKSAVELFKKAETKTRINFSMIEMAYTEAHRDSQSDRQRVARKGPRIGGRPFLKRYLSIGRPSQSTSESETKRKKGFWGRYRR